MFGSSYNFATESHLAAKKAAIREKKCIEAEKAAWAARPKVYKLNPPKRDTTVRIKDTCPGDLKQFIIEDYSSQSPSIKLTCENTAFVNNAQIKEKVPDLLRPARFFTLGCQGDAKEAQLKVAEYMNKIASDPRIEPPDFILILGDNFYDDGVDFADDKMFYTHFYDVYSNPKFPHLRKIPCFVILGNHDENRHTKAEMLRAITPDHLAPEKGLAKGIHQVAHTYLPKAPYTTTEALKNLYRSHTNDEVVELDLDKLPSWNMPSPTYAIISGNTQIFCINSSAYVSDYLKFLNGDTNPYNQTQWLMKEVKKARDAGRQVLLALHHPLVTPGKRAFHNDIKLYLSEEEITSPVFKKRFGGLMQGNGPSYNTLMHETLKQQNLIFDTILTAHDHDMYYYNNKTDPNVKYPICQMTSGGGGDELQKREDFAEQKYMGCFLKRHGFTDVRCPQKGPIEFFLHTVPNSTKDLAFQLHFDNVDQRPFRYYSEKIVANGEVEAIEKFCCIVLNAIDDYMGFLAPRQTKESGSFLGSTPWSGNVKHGHEGVERAHKIWAYISQKCVDDYKTTIEKVYLLSRWDSNYTSPSDHSFITILNKKIAQNYFSENHDGHTMDSLYKQTIEKKVSRLIL